MALGILETVGDDLVGRRNMKHDYDVRLRGGCKGAFGKIEGFGRETALGIIKDQDHGPVIAKSVIGVAEILFEMGGVVVAAKGVYRGGGGRIDQFADVGIKFRRAVRDEVADNHGKITGCGVEGAGKNAHGRGSQTVTAGIADNSKAGYLLQLDNF